MPNLNVISTLFPELVQDSFENNELAFLALTTKVEQPLRDKIAWLLNKSIGQEKLINREWKRHDLVIMNKQDQEIESIIEFKNQLGFKIKHDEYKKGFCNDLYKSALSIRYKAQGNMEKSEILFIMFGRTLDNEPNIKDPNVLQSMPYIKGAFSDCKNHLITHPILTQEQYDNFKDDWDYWLDEACIPREKRHWLKPINGGSFLNIGIKIITSIIGPFSAQEVFDLNDNSWNYPLNNRKLELPKKHVYREKYLKK